MYGMYTEEIRLARRDSHRGFRSFECRIMTDALHRMKVWTPHYAEKWFETFYLNWWMPMKQAVLIVLGVATILALFIAFIAHPTTWS